jgi:two-component system, chemotaxis family, CheB/CheR fusion protein
MLNKKINPGRQLNPKQTPESIESDPQAPDSPPEQFPIVGIGASAGGLAAFEAFFSGMPAETDPNMAFVLVQHLAPDHNSILSELVRRYTRMEVLEVEDGMTVQPNHAYIIPPNHDMAFLNGALQLLEPSAPRGLRMPIDFFFRSLARDQRERAICIILSGTGCDGTLGLREIKGGGGMVMAQSPDSTEYGGMPSTAIATGLVDYILSPADMANQLIAYSAQTSELRSTSSTQTTLSEENALKKLFSLFRDQAGHDFSQYKRSTIHRRIERRMAVHQIETIEGYVKFSQQNSTEIEALFHDLLIGVTGFFRDPRAFEILEKQVLKILFSENRANTVIRIWAPGCSTGEEAYSIAILIQEYMEIQKLNFQIQLFATDIDAEAISTARAGIYPVSIAADISEERLQRFFTTDSDGGTYRIRKNIRDMMIFSEQDVIKDPPYSKLDLISCRNLLIYMGNELQKKLIPLFHYSLNPGGILFLGTSESIGDFNKLFTIMNRKQKIYQRKEYDLGIPRLPLGRFHSPLAPSQRAASQAVSSPWPAAKTPLKQLAEQALLQQVVPAGALVNSSGDILYLHGRTGLYLEPPPGESGPNNILKMAREGLRRGLTTTLHKAVASGKTAFCPGLQVRTNGVFISVDLTIRPVYQDNKQPLEAPLFLVILANTVFADTVETLPTALQSVTKSRIKDADVDSRIVDLRRELQDQEEYLQATNDELKSANDEMQSKNEEMQSTNEELETSKEELQSVNDELARVNAELQTNVVNLSQANNDMNNLLAGTGIATIFVDTQLRILRFTPTASHIINLIQSDMGRPVGHIASNLIGYDNLIADAQSVVDTLIPIALDVQSTAKKWYSMAILPYRTLDNVIEGVVFTFVDITESRELLRKTNNLQRLAIVVRDAYDPITVFDLEGQILTWNPAAEKMYGWSEAEAQKMNIRALLPQQEQADTLGKILQLSQANTIKPFQSKRITKEGKTLEIWITCTALVDENGKLYGIATTERIREP